MPPMETPQEEVVKKTIDNIFSTLPTLQTLPTLTIIDNLSRGVEDAKQISPKVVTPLTQVVKDKHDKVEGTPTKEKRD